jgi:hypothetical protein
LEKYRNKEPGRAESGKEKGIKNKLTTSKERGSLSAGNRNMPFLRPVEIKGSKNRLN